MLKFKTVAAPALTAGLLLSASPSLAQEVRFSTIDRNADGFLTRTELLAVFGSRGEVILSNDRNGDGVVSKDELRAGSGSRDDDRDDDRDDRDDDGHDDDD